MFDGNLKSTTALRSTTMHEIGHSFQIDEVDDSCQTSGIEAGGEVHSGTGLDNTVEDIRGTQWGIMTTGYTTPQALSSYFAFSIKEPSSVKNAGGSSGTACDETA